MTDAQVYGGAAVLGAMSGMRSMAAPAIVSKLAHTGLLPVEDSQLGFIKHRNSVKTMAVLAAGEFVFDKLPFVPSRTKIFPLVTRAATGAFSGSAFASAKRRPGIFGAAIGALAAVGAAYGVSKVRQTVGKRLHIPDPIVAVAEDALVAGCGFLVLKALRSDENAE